MPACAGPQPTPHRSPTPPALPDVRRPGGVATGAVRPRLGAPRGVLTGRPVRDRVCTMEEHLWPHIVLAVLRVSELEQT